jgi:signal peptidase II
MASSTRGKILLAVTSLALATIIVIVDQLIKNVIVAEFALYESRPFLGDVIRLTYVLNDSAAFSHGFGLTGLFTIISSAATIALIWFILTKSKTTGWSLIAAVMLGGVVGNLVDRLFRSPGAGLGKVVDYIQIPFNFPIFNLADIAIVSMASLAALLVLLGYDIGKPRKAKDD